MKFTIRKDTLASIMSVVTSALPTRSTLPILHNVLVTPLNSFCLQFYGSDTKIGVSEDLIINHEGTDSMLLPEHLNEFLMNLKPGDKVTVSNTVNGECSVEVGTAKYVLYVAKAEDYINRGKVENYSTFRISQRSLIQRLRQVVYAVSNDEFRQVMTGVNMSVTEGSVIFAATDTHRMSIQTAKISEGEVNPLAPLSQILPAPLVKLLMKHLKDVEDLVTVMFSDKMVRFQTHGDRHINFDGGAIDGPYPTYMRVLPDRLKQTSAICSTESLRNAVRRVLPIAKEAHNVRMYVEEGDLTQLVLSSNAQGLGSVEAKIEVICEKAIRIAVNPVWFMDTIKVIDEKDTELMIQDEFHAMTMGSPTDHDSIHLIMPMSFV